LEEIIFENFNIAENNIINIKTGQGTKVSNKEMGGPPERRQIFVDETQKSFEIFLNILFWMKFFK
jgi:hypothetical protein